MKALPILGNASRTLALAFIAAALVAITGCGLTGNEEDGDKDPKFGAYDVVVTPKTKALTITPESGVLSFAVDLSVVCLVEPDDLANCEAYSPNWDADTSFESFFRDDPWHVRINDPRVRRTTVNISLTDVSRYLATLKSSSLTGNTKSEWVRLFPHNVPSNLKLTPPGGGRIDLTITVPGAPADREEESADDAGLTAVPSTVYFSTTVRSQVIQINYKGPSAELTASANNGQFVPTAVGGLPFPLSGDGSGPGITVTWNGSGIQNAILTLVARPTGIPPPGTPPPKPVAATVALLARP